MNGTSITIAGNIATQPEQRMAGSIPYTRFRIACSERRRDKTSGEWVDTEPSWYTVSVFRALGENAARSLQKGERVLVSGRLRIRNWETATSRGTDAEIDAEAIGHDLRWGTTRFERTASSSTSTQAAPTDHGWATPGAEPTANDDTRTSWPLSPVPAGAPAGDAGEPPF